MRVFLVAVLGASLLIPQTSVAQKNLPVGSECRQMRDDAFQLNQAYRSALTATTSIPAITNASYKRQKYNEALEALNRATKLAQIFSAFCKP